MIKDKLIIKFEYDHPHEPVLVALRVCSADKTEVAAHVVGDEAIHAYARITKKTIDDILREGGCPEWAFEENRNDRRR